PDWYRQAPETGGPLTVRINRVDGKAVTDEDWADPEARAIAFVVTSGVDDAFALLCNASENGVEFALPEPPASDWELELSSDTQLLELTAVGSITLAPVSFALLRSRVARSTVD